MIPTRVGSFRTQTPEQGQELGPEPRTNKFNMEVYGDMNWAIADNPFLKV